MDQHPKVTGAAFADAQQRSNIPPMELNGGSNKMRVIIGLALGLLVGFGGATWFYAHGGNIVIAGRALMPDKAISTTDLSQKGVTPESSKTPRVVVRDITDASTSPSASTPVPSPNKDSPNGINGSTFIVIKWPSW
jgi:cytoskeletal protein RodZ